MSILLKNCRYIVTQDDSRRILENKDIYIENEQIKEIGSVSHEAEETIDASQFVVAPGLINTHTHVPMSIMRGHADDMQLMPWLENIWSVEAKMMPDDIYQGTLLSALEMIASGTTCFLDMYSHEEEVARATDESGLRGFVSLLLIDPDKTSRGGSSFEGKEGFLKKWSGHPRITPIVAPHTIYTCSAETLNKGRELAEKHDTLLNIHVSETKKEVDDCVAAHGKRVVEYLDSLGFLSGHVIAAHCVHVNGAETGILASKDVTVSHNPTSNMKLAVGGVAPVPAMMSTGVNVTLGTDSAVSNNSLSMFEAMKTCTLIHKHTTNNAGVLPAQQVFDMATRNAARYLNINAGSIEEGKLADIILIDLKAPAAQPARNIVSNLVYSTHAGCVDTTIVNGKVLMENCKISTIDAEKVYEYVNKPLE
jgi:5-methylthioadenosine/S-adenosylhomocysteine deaminase